MIKQIQLRGISRTPSDRMSDDGGLSESLNMYMDTAENAPALVPKDVTSDLGLPADLQAERIFIHKTVNYENYIAVQSDKVVAYTPDIEDEEPLLVLELAEGETVNDITAVGNTLIISTTKSLYYVLYKDRQYSFLGNKIPFPRVTFSTGSTAFVNKKYKREWSKHVLGAIPFEDRESNGEPKDPATPLNFEAGGEYYPSDLNVLTFYDIDEDEWNSKDDDGNNSNSIVISYLTEREKLIKEMMAENKALRPIIIRYSIEQFDGFELSSIPYVLFPSEGITTTFQASMEMLYNTSSDLYMVDHHGYNLISLVAKNIETIGVKIDKDSIDDSWNDIIKKIKFYISPPLPLDEIALSSEIGIPTPTHKDISSGSFTDLSGNKFGYKKTLSQQADVTFKLADEAEDNLLSISSNVFLVHEVDIFHKNSVAYYTDEFKNLLEGDELDIKKYVNTSSEGYLQLEEQDRLNGDDIKHYIIISDRLDVFNNKLILNQPRQIISYDHGNPSVYLPDNYDERDINYEISFFLRTHKDDKVIKKTFEYKKERGFVYAFVVFPDSRAFKMIVKATLASETKYGEFEMLPHPYLDCAYYYGGLDKELIDLCTLSSAPEYTEDNVDALDNKLLISEQDNAFAFSVAGRYTFQSKIVGVAIATTALSQGQFGQFPLYVFTEDGIWAMETAADGSFISQKPLSREVCVNPDSICAIDNAVVFVTDKAVMMVQGSQVMNISPYMNGRHYMPNESAVNLINKQEGFSEFESVITDDDPFMKFMRKAKVAYDYTGQRLIFISKQEDGTAYGFQYVYKIDTQTWHKLAITNLDLVTPINSYPECLVQGNAQIMQLWCSTNADLSAEFIDRVETIFWETYEDIAHDIAFDREMADFFINGEVGIPVDEANIENLIYSLHEHFADIEHTLEMRPTGGVSTRVYSLSTVLDASTTQDTAKGIVITRPFDLGMPDVYKSIKSIKIRGDYDKGNIKYILQGSDNGRDFYTLSSLRGKSWKMFRIFILADLEPTERISWIDVDFEPRYQNKLR